MSSRPPAAPPQLPGFKHVRHLGSGGFADVFLYEQELLGRRVAVKVLLSDKLGADAIRHFTNEANLMAQLSNHPSIVSVYQAGVSVDGRPYLVMEYCSRPNLQVRYRASKFSEAEALKVGIQIAGAVETVHRAGILHRDIKPANILVTEYGRPALTDFGIAATTSSNAQVGMSVPWAPPEALADGRGDQRADVYSLAATLYTLLAGRSPFELPGASNTSVDLLGRVQSMPVPPIGRQEVSSALERVLSTAMSKHPDGRCASAMEFARALQRVQIELGMQPTTVDVVEDVDEALDAEEDGGFTRIRSVLTIEAQPQATLGATTAPNVAPPMTLPVTKPLPAVAALTDQTVLRGFEPARVAVPVAPAVADTALRQPQPAASEPGTPVRRSRLGVIVAAAAAVVLVGGVATAFVLSGAQRGAAAPTGRPSAAPVDAVASRRVPDVTGLKGTVTGQQAVFTWTNPDPQAGDTYRWRQDEAGVRHDFKVTDKPTVSVPITPGAKTCIAVLLVRGNGRANGDENAVLGCTP